MASIRNSKVKVLLVGYRKFSELINAVVHEFEDQAEVTIVESVANGNTDYRSLVALHEPDVVASAGSNAAYLSATLSVPVISQPVSDADIVEALEKAQRIARNVHLFYYQAANAEPPRLLESLQGMVKFDFTPHGYTTSGQASESFQLAMAEERPGVIVGPSYTCHMAEQAGLPAILVYSRSSARDLLRAAIEAGNAYRGQTSAEPDKSRDEFVIRSPSMERLAKLAAIYARGDGAVLIQGESGTGKEHIAKEIHRLSDYQEGPLVALNCGSIPNDLFESELFGYVEGAFTSSRRGGRIGLIERANGGVLYLDEVGEMPASQQVKLLRVLQEKRVRPVGSNREIPLNFKLLSATNRDLGAAVAQGRFRDDLYYRLNVFSLQMPPLRERVEDVKAIAQYYLQRYARQYQVAIDAVSVYAGVAQHFANYHWPGNVRELQNFIERLVVNQAAQSQDPNAAPLEQVLPELFAPVSRASTSPASLREQETDAILEAMSRFNGNKNKVAQALGISTTTLWRRLRVIENSSGESSHSFSSGTTSG